MQVQPRSSNSPRRRTESVDSLSNPKRGRTGFRIRIRACGAGALIKEALSVDSNHAMISHTRVAPTGTSGDNAN
jgi:hypothetical protein